MLRQYKSEDVPALKALWLEVFDEKEEMVVLGKVGLQGKRCGELGKKNLNRLVELLTNDAYLIDGRGQYKDEFVTCGGIPLDSVDKHTLESKAHPNLFYAGEVLDIDGVTGGFNFHAAWTTAWAVAKGIEKKVMQD